MTFDRTLAPYVPSMGSFDTYANMIAQFPSAQTGAMAFCADAGWCWYDGTYWRITETGGASSKQVLTSGGSATVGAGANIVVMDGVATTFALTLRAPRGDGDVISVQAATAVSVAFSTVATAPATVIKTTPSTLAAGVGVAWIYNSSNTTWYRLY
jgi:hypothetical protein